jgi:uncharacterized alpha-E superfamily protein
MISRVADHCFWLGRYVERVENTARMVLMTRNLALDAELLPRQCWQLVVGVSGELKRFREMFGEEAASDGEHVQRFMTWDRDNPTSIVCSVGAARENARSIREVVSLDCWQALNEVYLWLNSDEGQRDYEHQRYAFFRRLWQSMQMCTGLFQSTMLHDTPLDFIRLGILLERAGQTARILDVHHDTLSAAEPAHREVEIALWLALLRACSGFEPFMKRYQGRVTRTAVAAFLILEPAFPRSVRYCVTRATGTLRKLRDGSQGADGPLRPLEQLSELDAWLSQTAKDALKPQADSLSPDAVHQLLTRVVVQTAEVCEGVGTELIRASVSAQTQSQSQ